RATWTSIQRSHERIKISLPSKDQIIRRNRKNIEDLYEKTNRPPHRRGTHLLGPRSHDAA
ncbi:unnamed protein product, partial [Musa acuminata var. zebrina]